MIICRFMRVTIFCFMLAGCSSGVLAPVEQRTVSSGAGTISVNQFQTCQSGRVRVQKGDTLYAISRRCNVPLRALISENRLQAPYTLTPRQVLILPVVRQHSVQAGETLYGISRLYNVDVTQLVRVNRLDAPYLIIPGQKLVLPGQGKSNVRPESGTGNVRQTGQVNLVLPQKRPEIDDSDQVPSSSKSVILPKPRPGVTTEASVNRSTGNSRSVIRRPVKAPASDGRTLSFSWPLKGKVISGFGPKSGGQHNDGINIAARRHAPVKASETGTVAYSGNGLRGFGNLLLLKHKNGYVTAYAHNEKLLVRRGQSVHKGQVIARVGSTGNVERPQLHFEIRKGTQAINPKKKLKY